MYPIVGLWHRVWTWVNRFGKCLVILHSTNYYLEVLVSLTVHVQWKLKSEKILQHNEGFIFILVCLCKRESLLMSRYPISTISKICIVNIEISISNIKGTQAWDIFEFFLTYIKSLHALGKFSKKVSLSFLRFSPEFRSSNIYAVTEHTRNQIFFWEISKKFFPQNLHYGPIRWVPRRLFQILIFYSRNLHFN